MGLSSGISRRGAHLLVARLVVAAVWISSLAIVEFGVSDPASAQTRLGVTYRVSVDSMGTQGDNSSWTASVSSDGRFVAFASSASNLVPDDTNGDHDIFVRDRVAGTTDRVSVSSSGTEANGASMDPAISADGRFVAFDSRASNLSAGDTNGDTDIFVHDRLARTTTRMSVSATGGPGGRSEDPVISADGRFVAFWSEATDLVVNDTNGANDVFVRDRIANQTERVSVSAAGLQSNGSSFHPAISSSGRVVAFESEATNLVTTDANAARDVFVRDRQAGSTALVSVSSLGVQAAGFSRHPAISGAGTSVAFYSEAPNLVIGDTNLKWDVFVRDLGAKTTERVSVSSTGVEANDTSAFPAISADGRVVAFSSDATNLGSGSDGGADVFVRDRDDGETDQVSVSSTGVDGNDASWPGSLSADGRFVAFDSYASNLVVSDTNRRNDVFVHDRGEETPPVVSSFAAAPTAFSPDNDGTKDTTTFTATISDESPPIEWTLRVRDLVGFTARTWSGAGTSVSQSWDGRNSSGQVVADGGYTATITATDFWGNESSANTQVTVDTGPPLIEPLAPLADHNTLQRRPTVRVRIRDALSAVEANSLVLRLDGAPVAASFDAPSGILSFAPTVDLTLGIHELNVSAADSAGNIGSLVWRFNVLSVTPGPGDASLATPVAPVVFPPNTNTVRFDVVDIRSSDSTVEISSTMHAGRGNSRVRLPLDRIRVRFTAPGGLNPVDRYPLAGRTLDEPVAAVAASEISLSFPLRGRVTTVGPLEVAVPDLHRLTGGTATLEFVDGGGSPTEAVPLGVSFETDDPLAQPIGCGASEGCTIAGTVSCAVDSLAPDACEGTSPDVYLNVGDQNVQSFVIGSKYPAPLNGSGRTVDRPPGLECGAGVTCAPISPFQPADGFKTFWVGAYDNQTDTSLFGVYGRHFAYTIADADPGASPEVADHRVLWQQTDVRPGSAECVKGVPASGSVRVRVVELANTSEPLRGLTRSDDAPSVGNHDGPALPPTRTLLVKLQRLTAADDLEYAVSNSAHLREVTDDVSLKLRGDFETQLDETYKVQVMSEPYSQTIELEPVPGAVVNRWLPQTGSGDGDAQAQPAEVMTGVEYERAGLPEGDALRTGVFFKFNYEAQCLQT